MGTSSRAQKSGSVPKYADCDPATIAPLNSDGHPNLYQYMPTRLVPKAEAEQKGWGTFYEGTPCRHHHIAPRYVSNPRLCVDCDRVKKGKATIGGVKQGGTPDYAPYTQRKRKVGETGTSVVTAVVPIEPDRQEKRFLEAYAELKDFDKACDKSGTTFAQMMSRMSYSAVFKTAVNALELQLNMRQTPPPPEFFEWTDDKRDRLIQVFVDTGEMATARDSIRVTPSEYYAELERNPDFATAIKDAELLAFRALEDVAVSLAVRGNDKLLAKIMAAKMPEYRERVSMDLNVTEKSLTDEQLRANILRLVKVGHQRIIDANFSVVEPQRAISAEPPTGGSGASSQPEPDLDLL